MKYRTGFVSNSSSTAFMITNKSNEDKSLLDFAEEVHFLYDQFFEQYPLSTVGMTKKKFFKSAKKRNQIIAKGEFEYDYGDEDYDVVGRVFDYMLRDGGETENFKWKFSRSLRGKSSLNEEREENETN
ncbi:MAG: hypothetical protein AABY32_04320 [Nanoarchaeota archaeon]